MGSRRRGGGGGDVLVDELASKIEKFVRITDLPELDSSDDGDYNSDDLEGYEPYGPEPSKKSLEKSAAFSSPSNVFSSVASSDEEAAAAETGLRLLFPDQLQSVPLLSALKGSREKQGSEPKKLSVSWAPDVYDPIPNSLSHSVGTKQKKSRKDKDRDNNNNNKKNGKKGQKGNSSRSSGGSKDKKQLRGKHGGRSAKGYKTMGADDDDIDVGSPDYCGSSFLKASSSELHYSLAEAL